MVQDSGLVCLDRFKVKGPNVKKNDMESSASALRSPLQSTSTDVTSVHSTPAGVESASVTTETDTTPPNATETDSTRFKCASWSKKGIPDMESAVLKPKKLEIGATLMTSESTQPPLLNKNDSESAPVPERNVETAVATPTDTFGSTLINGKAMELPSVSQKNMGLAASMPHFTVDYDLMLTDAALVDRKALDLPLISQNHTETTASLQQIPSNSYEPENKIVIDTSSISPVECSPGPKIASESTVFIPHNNTSSAKNAKGLVLASHDRLEALVSPTNTVVFKSTDNNINNDAESIILTPQSTLQASASLPRNILVDETKSIPQNNMDSNVVELASLNENTMTAYESVPKTTSETFPEPNTFTKSALVDKIDKCPAKDQTLIGSTNNTVLINNVAPFVINQNPFPSVPQTNMEAAASVPQQTKNYGSTSNDKFPLESSLLSENGVKSTLTPQHWELELHSVLQNNIHASVLMSGAKVEPLSKSRTTAESPSVDKMLCRNSNERSSVPQNKMEATGSMPQTTKEHSAKLQNLTKSPAMDKMDKNPIINTSEILATSQNKMAAAASFPKPKTEPLSKSKTITKSSSVDKMLSRKSSESPSMPQNKMAATASKPKTSTESAAKPNSIRISPSVDRMSLKKTSKDASKKEKITLSEAAPVPTLISERRPSLRPPWRGGSCSPWPPCRSLTSPSLGQSGFIRRSESSVSVNTGLRGKPGLMRAATSLPHIPKAPSGRPCLLVALRPTNLQQQRDAFFQAKFQYEPQFQYEEPEPRAVLDKYREGSGLFLQQAVGIMECVLKRYGSYEIFEEATGGNVLPKSQVWAAVRKYLQKEGCVGEVVVRLSEELLSQAVMVVENCRPTLTINLSGARQHWLEGMLRHEIGTHYLRGVNNSLQPWASSENRKQLGLKPANPTEEGLASLHSVLLRKQPFLWRAALLYYTVFHAASMSFSQLFSHIGRFVHNPDVRWEYCLRAKRGQTDTSKPGCFSKDQVYLDGILRILRHRRSINFQLLTALGKVSFEDVERLRSLAVLSRTRIPHFMRDSERYLSHLDHIVAVNELDDAELEQLLP